MSGDTNGHDGEDADRSDDESDEGVDAAGDGAGPDSSPTDGVGEGASAGDGDGPLPGDLNVDTDAAVEELDRRFVELLSWLLETETRARIYVYLRQEPNATSDEVADGTGLYPSTVRECLAEMAEDGILERQKRQHAGAGNNPYEYSAIAPSDLVGQAVGDLQSELNSVFNLDCLLGCADRSPADDAVTISVERGDDDSA
jgi:predicted transcriptional regulator